MTPGLTAASGAAASALVAAASRMPDPGPALLWTAGIIGAVGVIIKALHLGELLRGTRNFLRDYNGEPARPGVEARPSLPERIANIEAHSHQVRGTMPTIATGLDQLFRSAEETGQKVDRLDERVLSLDQRVTDHRRRNEQQAALLRAELERRASDLEVQLRERNNSMDARLDRISDDLLRAEAMRAALVELGLDVEPPPHHA